MRRPAPDEAWVGLGSNVGDREGWIQRALERLGEPVVEVSPIVETAPWGILDQPWFLNGVARLRWTAPPRALLERCLEVERLLGRVRGERHGPRIIDLDVLIAGAVRLREDGFTLPHPGIGERRSVLEPWARVAPELIVPGLGETVAVLAERARRAFPEQALREARAGVPATPGS